MEINGFEIEEYNIHGLADGKKDQICPVCSPNRSPKNQKAKCASADWERGLLTCHHCGEITQLHKYKRKTDIVYNKPKSNENSTIDPRIVEYFSGRGISHGTLQRAKITTKPGWIEFNYFANGELINRKSRDGKKQFRLEKGCELTWYNFDALLTSTSVIICEGEVDVLSYMEAGYDNVISVPNGASNFSFLDTSIDHFDGIEKVYLSVDDDEAGQKLQDELVRRIGAEKILLIDLQGAKDANEFIISHDVSALAERVASAGYLPLEHVQTLTDVKDELEEFVTDGFKPGHTIGLDNFDSIFSTYTGQFITVTGIPSSGKSDFVDQMVVGYNQKYDWKTAYVSPENKPTFLHVHKLIRKIGDWMPEKEDIGGEKWNEIAKHIDENYFFVDMDSFSLEAVLKKGAELVKRKGIRCLVIDPFNKVKLRSGKDLSITDYTMDYLTAIENFCRKYNVLVIVVAHPTKMYKDQNGKIEEPTMYNIKGGGEWYDASYHGLLVHRDYEAKTVKVKVLKVKFQHLGSNGEEAHFKWDHVSGRYCPIEHTAALPWEDA